MEEIKSEAEVPIAEKKGDIIASKNVVRPMEAADDMNTKSSPIKILLIYLVVLILGVGTGFGVHVVKAKNTVKFAGQDVKVVKTATEEGVQDASSFKDTATGKIIANDGKLVQAGTHILIRGDASQNVYLTSSVVDLSKYEGKNVQVWGNTYNDKRNSAEKYYSSVNLLPDI